MPRTMVPSVRRPTKELRSEATKHLEIEPAAPVICSSWPLSLHVENSLPSWIEPSDFITILRGLDSSSSTNQDASKERSDAAPRSAIGSPTSGQPLSSQYSGRIASVGTPFDRPS